MEPTRNTTSLTAEPDADGLAPMRRYGLDPSTKLVGDGTTAIGGSPLRLFRLTPAGRRAFDEIAGGSPVAPSRLSERLLEAGAIHPLAPSPEDRRLFGPGDVTVVVPTHETPPARLYDILVHCLDTAGVMFVDDGSGTPLTGVRGATLLRLRHNSGPAAARNAGARAAETPIVAFVDTDVGLQPGWLDGLLWHFDDPRVGFVAPRVASGSVTEVGVPSVARYEERHSPLDLGAEPARVAVGTRVGYVPAAALVVRRSALGDVGGFDPDLRCGEDVDFVWRVSAAGWRGRYDPAVVVHHQPRPSWRALVEQRRAYGESAAALAAVHGSAVAPVRMSVWSLAVWGLAAVGRPFSAVAVAGGTALALIPKLRGVPAVDSLRLAGSGHLAAGRSLATAVRRTWLPLIGVGSLWSRRARWVAVASVAPAMLDGGPARLLDDVSYSVGVWKGVLGRRQLGPLLPALTSWPRPEDVAPWIAGKLRRRRIVA
jgi:mycofactocin system glycosyltransferase